MKLKIKQEQKEGGRKNGEMERKRERDGWSETMNGEQELPSMSDAKRTKQHKTVEQNSRTGEEMKAKEETEFRARMEQGVKRESNGENARGRKIQEQTSKQKKFSTTAELGGGERERESEKE